MIHVKRSFLALAPILALGLVPIPSGSALVPRPASVSLLAQVPGQRVIRDAIEPSTVAIEEAGTTSSCWGGGLPPDDETGVAQFLIQAPASGDRPPVQGSGVILGRNDNFYSVLTNWHVVQCNGPYRLQTADGRQHEVVEKQELEDLDAAVVYFESDRSYEPVELGDSRQLDAADPIFILGFPSSYTNGGDRNLYINQLSISTVKTGSSISQGYALEYSDRPRPGTSGSPLIDENRKLVGIHGQADDLTSNSLSGIPLHLVLETSRQFVTSLQNPQRRAPQISNQPTSPRGSTPIDLLTERPAVLYECLRSPLGIPTTYARFTINGEEQNLPVIRWQNGVYRENAYWKPEQRCLDASARFERYNKLGMLSYISAGFVNNSPVICALASRTDDCTEENILLWLMPTQNLNQALSDLAEVGGGSEPVVW